MTQRSFPRGRLPQTDRPHALSVAGSVCAHLLLLALIVIGQRMPDPESSRRPGTPGKAGGGGIQFIRIDEAPAPAAQPQPVPIPPPPPQPVPIPLPLRKLDVPLTSGSVVAAATPSPGSGAHGAGGGADGGIGTDSGPGTGGEGGEVFPPKARYSILPPLPQPSSVRGRTFRVHFWVNPDGRVTRVRVEPDIKDAAYRQEFLALMREYTFEPARRIDGTRVDGETTIVITL